MIKYNRATFVGEFVRVEKFEKANKQNNIISVYTKINVVLKKIHLAKDNSFFCPYARFKLGKGFSKLSKMLPGMKIKFDARYNEYKPGHFKLSHSTKIELICPEIPQWEKAHKEIKNYDMSDIRIRKP